MGPDTTDSPDGDGVAHVHLASTDDSGVGGGDGISEKGGLVHRDVVRDLRHSGGLGDVVLGPCAIVGEGHQVQAQAVCEGTTTTLAALEAGTTSGRDDAVTLLPPGDAGAELDDGAGGLMALGHNGTTGREGAADEAQVGVANTAVCDLDEHLTGPPGAGSGCPRG